MRAASVLPILAPRPRRARRACPPCPRPRPYSPSALVSPPYIAPRGSCQYYAAKGVTSGAGTISLGDNGADISGDGRFVVYAANYDLSTIRGTYEAKSTVSARNLFLFDSALGLTWQITKEGNETDLEAYCCPTASNSLQRDTCSKRNEMKGFCCWQRPCGHPTVDQRISNDGKSIVFWGDGYPDATHVNMDWDIFHYHIPTSTLTTVTRTSNKNFDEARRIHPLPTQTKPPSAIPSRRSRARPCSLCRSCSHVHYVAMSS